MKGINHMSFNTTLAVVENCRNALYTGNNLDDALDKIEACVDDIGPVTSVDLLERAAASGSLYAVQRLYNIFPYFVYQSWALVLALRCGHEDVARWLISNREVDLLAPVVKPTGVRMMLPNNDAFTRSGLTRKSITLFVNPMDPTLSTYVFTNFIDNETLEGSPYSYPCDLQKTCDIVYRMAQDNLFEDTVYDDLFRAAMVRAWKCLRHEDTYDMPTAQICLKLAFDLIEMHRNLGRGDERMKSLLGCLIVPRVSKDILFFIADNASQIFLEKLEELPWLQNESNLIREIIPHLQPGNFQQNELLLSILASEGFLDEIRLLESWEGALTQHAYDAAIVKASQAAHAEIATYLLAQKQKLYGAPCVDTKGGSDNFDDLLDGLLL